MHDQREEIPDAGFLVDHKAERGGSRRKRRALDVRVDLLGFLLGGSAGDAGMKVTGIPTVKNDFPVTFIGVPNLLNMSFSRLRMSSGERAKFRR
ncbi:MAG: hypothetical protein ACREB8_09410 [Pseudolabrys sp.]